MGWVDANEKPAELLSFDIDIHCTDVDHLVNVSVEPGRFNIDEGESELWLRTLCATPLETREA
jgi:hypothetical protein